MTCRFFLNGESTCKKGLAAFGKSRLVDDLAPDEFEALQAVFAKRLKRQTPAAHGVTIPGNRCSSENSPAGVLLTHVKENSTSDSGRTPSILELLLDLLLAAVDIQAWL
jgi:hypothetical protein